MCIQLLKSLPRFNSFFSVNKKTLWFASFLSTQPIFFLILVSTSLRLSFLDTMYLNSGRSLKILQRGWASMIMMTPSGFLRKSQAYLFFAFRMRAYFSSSLRSLNLCDFTGYCLQGSILILLSKIMRKSLEIR